MEWFRFFDLICFGSFVTDSERPTKIIPHETIAAAIGRSSSDGFKSGEFIARFTANVLPEFTASLHEHRSGKAREILNSGLGPLRRALREELLTFHRIDDSTKVHLVTGERWTPPKARALREHDRIEAEQEAPTVAPAMKIVRYLNSLKSNLFAAQVHTNIGRATDIAKAIDDKSRRPMELTKLHRISLQPQPFYGPPLDPHTVRVFAKNVSILALKNEVKHALIDGWTTFDLKSAQFAIVAKDWGMTELHTWLSTPGNDIWKTLSELYSTMDPAQVKPILKEATYSICYGMTRENVISNLVDGFARIGLSHGDANIRAMMFVEDAYVTPLFHHRERAIEKVRKNRGAKDCFGQWIAATKEVQPRKVLAQLSQAREMSLLLPAIDLASKRTNEFKIVLWEHDGFSVHFTRRDRVESESDRIMAAVNDAAATLGYPTRLERKGSATHIQPTR